LSLTFANTIRFLQLFHCRIQKFSALKDVIELTFELNSVNVASVVLVQLPEIPYATVLSLPLTATDLRIFPKHIYFMLHFANC